jgi:hypothetical protein
MSGIILAELVKLNGSIEEADVLQNCFRLFGVWIRLVALM